MQRANHPLYFLEVMHTPKPFAFSIKGYDNCTYKCYAENT